MVVDPGPQISGSELSSIVPEELLRAPPGIQEVLGLHRRRRARRQLDDGIGGRLPQDALRMLTLLRHLRAVRRTCLAAARRLSIGADDGRSAVLADCWSASAPRRKGATHC